MLAKTIPLRSHLESRVGSEVSANFVNELLALSIFGDVVSRHVSPSGLAVLQPRHPHNLQEMMRSLPRLSDADLDAFTAHVLTSALSALKSMWSVGLLHGDVKPGNICFGSRGDVKLIDFGLTTPTGSSKYGTKQYRPPPCFHGDKVGPEGDEYALKVVGCQMRLRGFLVTDGRTEIECMSRHGVMKLGRFFGGEGEAGGVGRWVKAAAVEGMKTEVKKVRLGWKDRRRALEAM